MDEEPWLPTTQEHGSFPRMRELRHSLIRLGMNQGAKMNHRHPIRNTMVYREMDIFHLVDRIIDRVHDNEYTHPSIVWWAYESKGWPLVRGA